MKRLTLAAFLLAAFFVVGCSSQPAAEENTPTNQETPADDSGASNTGGDSGVNVISPAAGGASPVTGAHNVQGGGSGVGQAAKDRARSAAGSNPQIPEPDMSDE
jgi:hypothetical protein